MTGFLRIDFLIERDPKALILNPGDASAHATYVAQFDFHAISALHFQIAFGHHAAIRKIAHSHAKQVCVVLNSNVCEEEKAVA